MDELAERAGRTLSPVGCRFCRIRVRARASSTWRGCAAGRRERRSAPAAAVASALPVTRTWPAYAAVVAEVEVDESVRLLHVWCAADGGLVINPDGAINQLEGGIIQAASWALKEGVRLDTAGISSRDWESYPVLRFSEVPEVMVELVSPLADYRRSGLAKRPAARPSRRSAMRSRVRLARGYATCR